MKTKQTKPACHKHSVWIVWGRETTARENPYAHEYVFNTRRELEAFLEGVSQATGWDDFEWFDSQQEANDYLRQLAADDE